MDVKLDFNVTDKNNGVHTFKYFYQYNRYTPANRYHLECSSTPPDKIMRCRYSDGAGFFTGVSQYTTESNYDDELLNDVIEKAVSYVRRKRR
jgi:hypothetical protein